VTELIAKVDERGVARLTMNRPDVRNAFNEALIGGLFDEVTRLGADKAVRVIVITGAGQAFSAGADLSMMGRVAKFTPEENKKDARRLAEMLRAIQEAPKPLIALVNGPAMAGAIGVVSACDIAIASDAAFFALTETKIGLVPAVISPFVIAAIGARNARRYFLTAERFDAETARAMGLVHIVAKADGLEAALDGVLKELLACAPGALGEAKDLIRAVANRPLTDEIMDDTAGRIARLRAGPEGREGIAAFLEKRKPSWAKG
jgi:methylglutaconyl-CoA hydratase